jgi:Holliday junction DNA helicase RuvA
VIGRLTGRVVAQDADGVVVVDVQGVGYEVLAPLGAVGRAPAAVDGRVTFFVHTHVREDVLSLFGFPSEDERLAFRTLIGVSSIGPKTALAVLSALPASELARAIAAKDLAKLTSIPGIGKKTAERLLLELRDKLSAGSAAEVARPTRAAVSTTKELLVGALTNMGYRGAEAERAASAVEDRLEVLELPVLVREALAVLAR